MPLLASEASLVIIHFHDVFITIKVFSISHLCHLCKLADTRAHGDHVSVIWLHISFLHVWLAVFLSLCNIFCVGMLQEVIHMVLGKLF